MFTCSSQPCMNGGTCFENANAQGYVCSCMVGWTGDNCQTRKFNPTWIINTKTSFICDLPNSLRHNTLKG